MISSLKPRRNSLVDRREYHYTRLAIRAGAFVSRMRESRHQIATAITDGQARAEILRQLDQHMAHALAIQIRAEGRCDRYVREKFLARSEAQELEARCACRAIYFAGIAQTECELTPARTSLAESVREGEPLQARNEAIRACRDASARVRRVAQLVQATSSKDQPGEFGEPIAPQVEPTRILSRPPGVTVVSRALAQHVGVALR